MSGQKHIVITVNAAWNLLNYRTAIIAMLQEEGHRVTLLAPRDDTAPALEALGCDFVHLAMTRRGKSPTTEAGVLARTYRALRDLKPDAVISFTIKNNIYAGIACRRLAIPFLPNVSGRGAVFVDGGLTVPVILTAYRYAFNRAATVFYQNPEDRQFFLDRRIGEASRAALLPGSGVDLEKFAAYPLPSKPGEPVFVMIARVLNDKGVREYAEAARSVQARVPGVRFILIGAHDTGPEYVPAADLARWQAEGLIDYRGAVADVRPIIAETDVAVLPSYYLEGTPRALMEAAAMGRPIVTTDTAGCRDTVVPGESGYLCEPRDARDLADKLLRLAEMPAETLAGMGAASRRHAEAVFDERIVIDAYRSAVHGALAGK
jgi:glycosyltransferase involved in cell wall biosynthesis